MLIIGTEECSYYTKSSLEMGGQGDCCYSVVMDKQDITFGSEKKVASAIEECMTEMKPTALFLVTTCVPEIIGEDYHSLVQETKEMYQIPVYLISTNHYSDKNGEYGFELVEKATGTSLHINKMRNGTSKKGGNMGSMAYKLLSKEKSNHLNKDMRDEQIIEMMHQKMGKYMSEEEMYVKIQSRIGGGERK